MADLHKINEKLQDIHDEEASKLSEMTPSEDFVNNSFQHIFANLDKLISLTGPVRQLTTKINRIGGDPSYIVQLNKDLEELYSKFEDAHQGAMSQVDMDESIKEGCGCCGCETEKECTCEADCPDCDCHSESYGESVTEEKDVEFYRTLDAKQLNACKLKLNNTIESLDHAIEFRARNSHLYFNTGDKAGTGDLYRMREQLEKLLRGWEEATEIYGM